MMAMGRRAVRFFQACGPSSADHALVHGLAPMYYWEPWRRKRPHVIEVENRGCHHRKAKKKSFSSPPSWGRKMPGPLLMVLFISQRILDAVSHPYSGTSQDSRWLLHRMDRGWRKERPGPSLTSQVHTIRMDRGSQSPQ